MSAIGNPADTHDFYFYNSANQVWNGSAFVAWNDANFATYRVAATAVGASGRFTAPAPADAVFRELRVRGATLALSYVVWADEVATLALIPTANAISAQIANDQLEGENGWDDGPLVSIQANAATAATEIGKVPRASTAIPAGGDFAWNAETDTANKLTLNITNEE